MWTSNHTPSFLPISISYCITKSNTCNTYRVFTMALRKSSQQQPHLRRSSSKQHVQPRSVSLSNRITKKRASGSISNQNSKGPLTLLNKPNTLPYARNTKNSNNCIQTILRTLFLTKAQSIVFQNSFSSSDLFIVFHNSNNCL